jgi:hypothetical protein
MRCRRPGKISAPEGLIDYATTVVIREGQSGDNRNQVMKNPPEYHYPQVEGSRSWIGQQLDDGVLTAAGAGKVIDGRPVSRPLRAPPRPAMPICGPRGVACQSRIGVHQGDVVVEGEDLLGASEAGGIFWMPGCRPEGPSPKQDGAGRAKGPQPRIAVTTLVG